MPLLPLVTISGSLTGHDGAVVTAGRLTITPTHFILSGGEFVAPSPVLVNVPGSGVLSFALSPSYGTPYTVVFDPTPADTVTPISLKSGYFTRAWLVPATGPVAIASL
jgi:hypothetical protein